MHLCDHVIKGVSLAQSIVYIHVRQVGPQAECFLYSKGVTHVNCEIHADTQHATHVRSHVAGTHERAKWGRGRVDVTTAEC